ncbi:MAG TPA: DUF4404 family protein [Candidatus Binatia bacterium]|nr:DUF4404 family protein [Candidatus Binatia bacterium]
MIRETISKIEAKLQGANTLTEESRAELFQLLGDLKREIAGIDEEKARTIAGQTEHLTAQATADSRNPELLKHSLEELSASVAGFEQSHPGLVEVVNRICTTLANIGI